MFWVCFGFGFGFFPLNFVLFYFLGQFQRLFGMLITNFRFKLFSDQIKQYFRSQFRWMNENEEQGL